MMLIEMKLKRFLKKNLKDGLKENTQCNLKMEYKLKTPQYYKGQIVSYINHRGNVSTGEIIRLETNYSYRNESYHVYGIMKKGNHRAQYFGENKILEVLNQ